MHFSIVDRISFLCFVNVQNVHHPISERYHVDEVLQDSREDCYLATLHIKDADIHDSRPYYLVVENERGVDRHAINLVVEGMFTGAFPNFLYFICRCFLCILYVYVECLRVKF